MSAVRSSVEGAFVCERTIAAVVNRTFFAGAPGAGLRSSHDAAATATAKKRRTARTFDMTVVWSTVSDKAYPQHELRQGMMITRLAGGIFEFETYRMRWVDEDARWSAEQEDELTVS